MKDFIQHIRLGCIEYSFIEIATIEIMDIINLNADLICNHIKLTSFPKTNYKFKKKSSNTFITGFSRWKDTNFPTTYDSISFEIEFTVVKSFSPFQRDNCLDVIAYINMLDHRMDYQSIYDVLGHIRSLLAKEYNLIKI